MSINPKLKYTTVSYKPAAGSSSHPRDMTNKATNYHDQVGDTFDYTSSILSDYEDLVVDAEDDDDDQSSYVLFNPTRSRAPQDDNNVSDILSLTNTTATNLYQDGDDDESDDDDVDELPQPAPSVPSASNLSNKINSWYNTSVATEIVDDNTASWNLDENLMEDSANGATSTVLGHSTRPNHLLLNHFYGDDLFSYFDQDDFDKFRSFHRLIDIKNFLLSRTQPNASTSSVRQLLLNALMDTKHPDPEPQQRLMPEYLEHLSHPSPTSETFVAPSTFSETTGSSLVMCGGAGFGGTASWNDI